MNYIPLSSNPTNSYQRMSAVDVALNYHASDL